MTTTMMTTTADDVSDEVERWVRRTAGLPVEFSIRPSAGGMVITITTPTGIPVPPDPGESPRAMTMAANILALADENAGLRAERDALRAQVELLSEPGPVDEQADPSRHSPVND